MNITGFRLIDKGYERLARCWVETKRVEVVLKRSLDGTYRVETRTDTGKFLGELYEAEVNIHLLETAAYIAAIKFNRLTNLSTGV